MITDTKLQKQLHYLGACKNAREEVGSQTYKQAWDTCSTGAWLIWLLEILNYENKLASRYLVEARIAYRKVSNDTTPDGRIRQAAERVRQAIPYAIVAEALSKIPDAGFPEQRSWK